MGKHPYVELKHAGVWSSHTCATCMQDSDHPDHFYTPSEMGDMINFRKTKLKEGIWLFLNKIKGHSVGYGTRPEITLRTARDLFTDLFPDVVVNQVDQALTELAESGQVTIDKGWVKAK